jgi:ArsR family transcriptional regulator, arsenate/arsenite/antimonite-responsive transcriptional repressor
MLPKMAPRERPADCCTPPVEASPWAEAERDRAVALFKALGDPTRLEVFRLIATQSDPICVCDVVDRFSVSQPTISHHLKVLRDAGLVTVSRRGLWAYYAADPDGLTLLKEVLAELTPTPLAEAS